jgi:hypothetical protein
MMPATIVQRSRRASPSALIAMSGGNAGVQRCAFTPTTIICSLLGANERSSEMKPLRASAVAISVLALSLTGPTVKAKARTPGSITVAFGAGLNTAQPGNTPNHHIIPQEFTVRIT